MKRFSICLTICVLIAGLIVGCGGARTAVPARQYFITIAAGSANDVYYPLGSALVAVFNKAAAGLNASMQNNVGAADTPLTLLTAGKANLAFVPGDTAYYAMNGMEMFKGKPALNMQALTSLYVESVQVLVLDQTAVRSVADLKGKRVAVGTAGSSSEANARQILGIYGITYNDVRVQYLPAAEAVNALKSGAVDAVFMTAEAPSSIIAALAGQVKIRLLPIAADKAELLIGQYPFYSKNIVPARSYANVDRDMETVAIPMLLAATERMDEEAGYKIVKTMYDNMETLQAAHPAGLNWDKNKALAGVAIPINPGTEKFFQEK